MASCRETAPLRPLGGEYRAASPSARAVDPVFPLLRSCFAGGHFRPLCLWASLALNTIKHPLVDSETRMGARGFCTKTRLISRAFIAELVRHSRRRQDGRRNARRHTGSRPFGPFVWLLFAPQARPQTNPAVGDFLLVGTDVVHVVGGVLGLASQAVPEHAAMLYLPVDVFSKWTHHRR